MKTLAAYPGKIGTENRDCFVGDQKVPCPQPGTSLSATEKLDLLPQLPVLDKRHDALFTTLFLVTILVFVSLALLKTKIFGKTLMEYIQSIWYLILLAVATVAWQYFFGLKIDDNLMALRISQWFWELLVLVSAYKISQLPNATYGNMFFLGVLYSFIIHGLKVAIRYYFYNKTLLYSLDRFLYGSLLVMAIAFGLGSLLIFFKRRKIL
jgi:hypothetical protein